jgi:lipopolysaccharide export system permease protein
MQIIDRYIGKAIALGVLGVLLVMFTLDTLINFAGETDDIGKAKYTVWHAIIYVLFRSPQSMYEIFPMIALLGAVLGLGMLAGNSELIAIRAAGVSIARITVSVLKTGAILIVFAIFIGEVVAPPAIQYAKLQRVSAMNQKISLNTDYGLWARDGNIFINIRRVEGDGSLTGINLYIYDEQYNLQETLSAASAEYQDDHWLMHRVTHRTIADSAVNQTYSKTKEWKTLLNPDVVSVVSVTPENLSVVKLLGYIEYLKDNQLDASEYELSFWSKLTTPITIAVMVMLAVPFVFGTLRDAGAGTRLLVGFLLGLGFFIVNKLAGNIGLVYQLPPIVAAMLPTLLVMGAGGFLLYRTR